MVTFQKPHACRDHKAVEGVSYYLNKEGIRYEAHQLADGYHNHRAHDRVIGMLASNHSDAVEPGICVNT
jgi:hypothetical protein